jgi:hypothetical protein
MNANTMLTYKFYQTTRRYNPEDSHLNSLSVWTRNCPAFMESRVSLWDSRDSTTGPCSKPDEYSSHPHTHFTLLRYILYHPHSTHRSVKWSSPLGFPSKTVYAFLVFPIRIICPVRPFFLHLSHYFVWFLRKCRVMLLDRCSAEPT